MKIWVKAGPDNRVTQLSTRAAEGFQGPFNINKQEAQFVAAGYATLESGQLNVMTEEEARTAHAERKRAAKRAQIGEAAADAEDRLATLDAASIDTMNPNALRGVVADLFTVLKARKVL